LNGLGRVIGVDLHGLGILYRFEGTGRGRHDRASRSRWCSEAQLPYLGDDPDGPGYLELEVGVAEDDHELGITWPPQDDMVRLGGIDHLERERLCVVVACVFEGDWQSDLPERDGLLAQDHSIEWMWAALVLVPGKP
jgi:hypothetical protein